MGEPLDIDALERSSNQIIKTIHCRGSDRIIARLIARVHELEASERTEPLLDALHRIAFSVGCDGFIPPTTDEVVSAVKAQGMRLAKQAEELFTSRREKDNMREALRGFRQEGDELRAIIGDTIEALCGGDGTTPETLAVSVGKLGQMYAAAIDDVIRIQHALNETTAAALSLTGERDELRATLINERGEGAGPSEGWVWDGSVWFVESPDCEPVHETNVEPIAAGWAIYTDKAQQGIYPTAREAMRAADAARGGAR